jgi:hypothetical protein
MEIKTYYFVDSSASAGGYYVAEFDLKMTPGGGKFVARETARKAPDWKVLFTKQDISRLATTPLEALQQFKVYAERKVQIKTDQLELAVKLLQKAEDMLKNHENAIRNPV